MKDELDDPTPRQESGSLEAGLFAGDAAEDNAFEARRPSTRNDEEGSIENTTEISDAVVDDEEDEDDVEELASDDEDEDDDDDEEDDDDDDEEDDDDDDEEEAE